VAWGFRRSNGLAATHWPEAQSRKQETAVPWIPLEVSSATRVGFAVGGRASIKAAHGVIGGRVALVRARRRGIEVGARDDHERNGNATPAAASTRHDPSVTDLPEDEPPDLRLQPGSGARGRRRRPGGDPTALTSTHASDTQAMRPTHDSAQHADGLRGFTFRTATRSPRRAGNSACTADPSHSACSLPVPQP
jgi:hypothetical protein